MKTVVAIILVIGLGAVAYAYYATQVGGEPPTSFRKATVKRGDLASTISATGTIEPVEVVDVGAQVVGPILDLGIDPADLKGRNPDNIPPKEKKNLKRIDWGTVVHEGTELAHIDPAIYEAQLEQDKANLKRAQADLKQYKAKRYEAERDWKRADQLHQIEIASPDNAGDLRKSAGEKIEAFKGISDSDWDLARATWETAEANVGVAEAAINQAEAAVNKSLTNVNYTVIRSPVEGVVVSRRVNVGQTVVATFSAASLFLIAKDLSKMQVWASVNEADIGRVRSQKDMSVTFTVDAYPGEVFHGTVEQVHLDAQSTQNVVVYTVIVDFDNKDMKLLPYLTANLRFEVQKRTGVLMVPNAALRWKPRLEQVAPEAREAVATMLSSRGGGTDRGGPVSAAPKRDETHGHLWVEEGEFLRPISVKVGLNDGTMTEVSSPEVKEGLEVVTGEVRTQTEEAETTNPFAPKIFRGKQKKS